MHGTPDSEIERFPSQLINFSEETSNALGTHSFQAYVMVREIDEVLAVAAAPPPPQTNFTLFFLFSFELTQGKSSDCSAVSRGAASANSGTSTTISTSFAHSGPFMLESCLQDIICFQRNKKQNPHATELL